MQDEEYEWRRVSAAAEPLDVHVQVGVVERGDGFRRNAEPLFSRASLAAGGELHFMFARSLSAVFPDGTTRRATLSPDVADMDQRSARDHEALRELEASGRLVRRERPDIPSNPAEADRIANRRADFDVDVTAEEAEAPSAPGM